MARVCIYLNFQRETEEVFNFYKSIFGGEFCGGGIMRFKDIPASDKNPPLPAEELNLVMHMELPILGGHVLMGSDTPASMGFTINYGNNFYIMLEPDSRDDTHKLFAALSKDGKVGMALQDTFWGAYYGSCTDKYGIQWMFNFPNK